MSVVANAVDARAPNRKTSLQGNNSVDNKEAKALAGLIHKKPLPVFKQTLQHLGKFYDKPSSSIPKVVECLRLDPGYAYQIMTKANAGLTRHKRKPAATLQHAVLVLGIPQVIEIGKHLPLISDMKQSTAKSRIYHLMARMYHAGVQAREMMNDQDTHVRDTAFISAQLRDAYLISLWFYASDEINKLTKSFSQQALFAPNGVLNSVGKIITKSEHFPQAIQQSFTLEPDSDRLVKTITLANHISRLAEDSWYSQAMKDLITQSSISLGKAEATLSHQTHQSVLIAAKESHFYPIKPAACRLVELTPNVKSSAHETEKTVPKTPAVKKKKVEPKQPSLPKTQKIAKPQQELELEVSLRKLTSLGRNKHSPQEILELGFNLLQSNSTKNPVAFFLLDKNKTFLKSRFIGNFDNKKQSIEIPLKQKNIFKALMQKQQAILLNSKNREKFSSLLSPELPLAIHEKDFAAMSVFIQNKPIGLFYLESNISPTVSPNNYQNFVTICKVTISALEEVKKNA